MAFGNIPDFTTTKYLTIIGSNLIRSSSKGHKKYFLQFFPEYGRIWCYHTYRSNHQTKASICCNVVFLCHAKLYDPQSLPDPVTLALIVNRKYLKFYKGPISDWKTCSVIIKKQKSKNP